MRIRISSDSTCDLSRDYLLTHQVELVPLYTVPALAVTKVALTWLAAKAGCIAEVSAMEITELQKRLVISL